MSRTIRQRGRNHWHSDGRPAGHGQPLLPMSSETPLLDSLCVRIGILASMPFIVPMLVKVFA